MSFYYVEDLVPPALADYIELEMSKGDMWSWTPQTVAGDTKRDTKDPNILDGPQLVRYMYHDQMGGPCHEFFQTLVTPLMWFFNDRLDSTVTNIDRIKANLLFPIQGGSSEKYNSPHIDIVNPASISMVYYVNESDGDTFIFDKSCVGEEMFGYIFREAKSARL